MEMAEEAMYYSDLITYVFVFSFNDSRPPSI